MEKNELYKFRGYDEFGKLVFKKDVVGTYEDACDYMYEYTWRTNCPDDNELGKVERLELIMPKEEEDFTVEEKDFQEDLPVYENEITELPF